jgi:hypothetical protein
MGQAGPAHLAMVRPDGAGSEDAHQRRASRRSAELVTGRQTSGVPDSHGWTNGPQHCRLPKPEVTSLATGSQYDTFPAWSPHCALISFTKAKRDGDYEIYVVRPDGAGFVGLPTPVATMRTRSGRPTGVDCLQYVPAGFKDEYALHPGNLQPTVRFASCGRTAATFAS